MIQAFVIAAITTDGYIAKDKDHLAGWTSKEDKKRFVRLTKEARVVVMGSNTFKTLPGPLKDRLHIVYTKNPGTHQNTENVEYTNKEPVELLKDLESRGYTSVAICGGAQIYDLFIKSGLITKLYLTIEPVLFGNGITLFQSSINLNLLLESTEHTDTGTVFLDYKII
ncbi:MAG: dihydrofolate reductase family protein [bacterium]